MPLIGSVYLLWTNFLLPIDSIPSGRYTVKWGGKLSKDKPGTKRNDILQAACRLVRVRGVANMTLEAVAREAGVSKGGLLYHFPAKEALIVGMINYLLEQFSAQVEEEVKREPDTPACWLRAYIKASFNVSQEEREINAALLAAIATNPDLLEPVRADYYKWQKHIEQNCADPVLSMVARLAADGFWVAELFGLVPLNGLLREQVMLKLLQFVKEGQQ